MGLFYSKQSIINEAYYINKNLQEALRYLSITRSKVFNNELTIKNVNTCEEMDKFNRLIEKTFGFENFALYLESDNISFNAYTVPLTSKFDVPLNIRKYTIYDKDGIRYKKEAKFSTMVWIHWSLFKNDVFTDREIMAIILHEIGHNFSNTINDDMYGLSALSKVINFLSIILLSIMSIKNPFGVEAKVLVSTSNTVQRFCIEVNNKIRKNNPEIVNSIYFIKDVVANIKGIVTEINIAQVFLLSLFGLPVAQMAYNILRIITTKVTNPILLVKLILGYKDEKLSDNFATMYTYGADLSSALIKMEEEGHGYKVSKFINTKTGLLGSYYNLMTLIIEILLTPFDEHPTTIARVNNQLIYMEKELNKKDIDRNIKKKLEKDIASCQASVDKLTRIENSVFDDPKYISRAYNLFMYNFCGGDIRELFTDKNREYDDIEKHLR